jgi:hypothetical protein
MRLDHFERSGGQRDADKHLGVAILIVFPNRGADRRLQLRGDRRLIPDQRRARTSATLDGEAQSGRQLALAHAIDSLS